MTRKLRRFVDRKEYRHFYDLRGRMRWELFLKNNFVFLLLIVAVFNSGCVMEDVSKPASLTDEELQNPFDYPGCVDGQGVGTNTIQVNFLFPNEATRVRLKRNGNIVAEFSQANQTTSHIDDDGLREGATYLYTCEALVDGIWSEGTNALQLSTIAVNAPVFTGIQNAVAQSGSSVLVTWVASLVDLPVRAYSYQVYANLGSTVNWTIPPKATVLQGSTPQALISGLGDELNYSFGVRACSEGNVCETNTIQRNLNTPDGGAPTTPGVTALAIQAGQLNITAPWVETNGGIARRYIYLRSGPTGGLNIGDYTLVKTYQVTGPDLISPPQALNTTSIQEGLTYHVIVQDEDPSGNRSAVTNFRTLAISDISPPSFGGITNLSLGPQTNSSLVLNWTAIPTEVADPVNGGVRYRIYSISNSQPVVTNPCNFGTLVTELNVSAYTAGATASYTMTGLNEKSYYSVCIKAIDSAGNLSFNNNFLQTNTLDTTPPIFSGVQTLGYDNQTGSLTVSWNPSTSADILSYRLTIWKNNPTPLSAITLFRTHASSPNGTSVSSSEFTVTDNDQVLVIVEACDATDSPFGTQNCSATNIQRAIVLPDVTPPQNFLGIRGPSDIATPAEGEFTVRWNAPSSWTGYRGFRVYSVNTSDNSLTVLRTCPCAQTTCSDHLTECSVQGLDAFRTYRLHVRAYDAANNETTYLNPATNFSNKRTSDTTAPTFASNLVVGPSPTFTLSWNTALDNQYGFEPGAEIRYEVYQNNGPFDFSNPNQPNGNLKATTASLSFQDTGFVEGQSYYYTVCARDSSNNKRCDQITRIVSVPDVTLPVITSLTSNKTVKGKVWDLSWTMSDNITTTSNLVVEIRSRTSVNGDLATTSDPVLYSGLGSDLIVSGNSASTSEADTLDPLSGPPDVKRKINYLVTIRDQQGNQASSNITVEIDNVLQVTSVKSQSGPLAGGKVIAVYGKGFTKALENHVGQDTTVTVGGRSCTAVSVISDGALKCTSPSATVPGSVEVRVRNKVNDPAAALDEQYSEASLTNAYTYSDTANICDTPGSWGPNFASGTGASELTPYVICNVTHLNNVRALATSGSYYRMGANIDLTAQSFNPLGTSVAKFTGSFNGDGHLIQNWSYNNAQDNIGLFGYVNGSFQITNLGLVNVSIIANQSVGGLIGVAEGGTNITSLISNVFVTGTVRGAFNIGGILGRKQNPHVNFNVVNSYFIGEVNATASGTGYGGGIAGFLGADAGGFFQNVYSEGLVHGTRNLGGLFGNLGQNKQVVDSFSRATVTGSESSVGGIAGEAKLGSTINNVYTEDGIISGVDSVGGVVGLSEGAVNNSTSRVVVNSTGRRGGGLIGNTTSGSILNSIAEKTVNGNNAAGGLVGEISNTNITNSHALGRVNSNGTEVGGLIGKVNVLANGTSTLNKVYATGFVNTIGSAVGGLIGSVDILTNSNITISEAFSRSQVGSNFTLSNQQYGGLVGRINTAAGSTAALTNCFASGAVYAGNYAGGLVGGYDNEGGTINVSYCYSASNILGGSLGRGGLFGRTSPTLHTVSNSYWDTDVSSKAFASGSGSYNGTATGYTTLQMTNYVTPIYTGWNFSTIWIAPTSGYPRLRYETP